MKIAVYTILPYQSSHAKNIIMNVLDTSMRDELCLCQF